MQRRVQAAALDVRCLWQLLLVVRRVCCSPEGWQLSCLWGWLCRTRCARDKVCWSPSNHSVKGLHVCWVQIKAVPSLFACEDAAGKHLPVPLQTPSVIEAVAEPSTNPVGNAAKQADNPQQPNDSGSQPMDTAAPEQAKPATAPVAPKARVTKERLLVKPPESMLIEDPSLAEDLRVQARWAAKAQGSWYVMVPLNKGGQEQAPPGSRSSEAAADVREVSAPELRSSFFASLAPAFVPRAELLPPALPRPDEAGARKLDWQAICQASRGFQKVLGDAGEGTVLTETVRQPATFRPRPGGVDYGSREDAAAASAAAYGTAEAATEQQQQQQGNASDTADNVQQPQGQDVAASTNPAAAASGGQQRGTADGQAASQLHHGQSSMAEEEPFDAGQQPIPSVALVVTTYNWAPYDLMSVRDDLTPASTFPGGQQSIKEAAEKATLYAGSLKKQEPKQAVAGESGSTIPSSPRAAECAAAAAAAKLSFGQQEAGQQGGTGDGAPGTVSSPPEQPKHCQQGSIGTLATGSGSGVRSAAAGSPPEREEDLFAVCKGITGLPEWPELQSPQQQGGGAATLRGGSVQRGQPAQDSAEKATGLGAGSAPPVGQGEEAGATAACARQEPDKAGAGTVPQPAPKQAAGSSNAPSKAVTEAAASAFLAGQMSGPGPAAAGGASAAAAPTAGDPSAADVPAAAAKRSAATAQAGAPPVRESVSRGGSSALLPVSQQVPVAAKVAVDPHLPAELSAQAMIQVMEHSARALAALVQSQEGPDPDLDHENGHDQGWVDGALQHPQQHGSRSSGSPGEGLHRAAAWGREGGACGSGSSSSTSPRTPPLPSCMPAPARSGNPQPWLLGSGRPPMLALEPAGTPSCLAGHRQGTSAISQGYPAGLQQSPSVPCTRSGALVAHSQAPSDHHPSGAQPAQHSESLASQLALVPVTPEPDSPHPCLSPLGWPIAAEGVLVKTWEDYMDNEAIRPGWAATHITASPPLGRPPLDSPPEDAVVKCEDPVGGGCTSARMQAVPGHASSRPCMQMQAVLPATPAGLGCAAGTAQSPAGPCPATAAPGTAHLTAGTPSVTEAGMLRGASDTPGSSGSKQLALAFPPQPQPLPNPIPAAGAAAAAVPKGSEVLESGRGRAAAAVSSPSPSKPAGAVGANQEEPAPPATAGTGLVTSPAGMAAAGPRAMAPASFSVLRCNTFDSLPAAGAAARPGAPATAELAGDLQATTAEAAVCEQVLQNGGKRTAEGSGEPKKRRRKRCKHGTSLWSFARYYR